MTVSSRIAVMNRGQVVQVATPAEIYEYPNSRYVAEFLGEVNMLEGRLRERAEGRVRVDCADAGATLSGGGVDAALGATVWIAVRPEKLAIARERPSDPALNVLEGEVWDIGYVGNLSIYHVRLPGGTTVKATQTNRARLVERDITWEDRVFVSWKPDAGVVLAV